MVGLWYNSYGDGGKNTMVMVVQLLWWRNGDECGIIMVTVVELLWWDGGRIVMTN